jgi:hypothetical protein
VGIWETEEKEFQAFASRAFKALLTRSVKVRREK